MEININEAIEQISEKLGLAITDISQLMPQVVKEKIIFSSIEVGVSLLVMICCIVMIFVAIKNFNKLVDAYDLVKEGIKKGVVKGAPIFVHYDDIDNDGISCALVIFGAFGLIISFLTVILSAKNLISWSVAPEASFFKYMLSLIK